VDAFLGANGTGVQVTGANLGMVIFKDGTSAATYALDASGTVTLTGVPNVTLTATGGVRVNKTGATVSESVTVNGSPVNIDFAAGEETLQRFEATSATVDLAGFVQLTGAFTFEKTVAGTVTKLLVGATEAGMFVGGGGMGLRMSNASLGMVIFKDGTGAATYALSGRGDVSLVGVEGVMVEGSILVERNTTGATVSEAVTAGGVEQTVQFGAGGELRSRISGTMQMELAGFVVVSGDFGVERTEAAGVTMLKVGLSGAEAFLGQGYGTADEMGVKVTQADLGLVVYRWLDGGAAEQVTYALQGQGQAGLVGVEGLVLSGSVTVARNTTGGAVAESVAAGGGSVTVAFGAGEGLVTRLTGDLELEVAGALVVSGSFGFERTEAESAGVLTTKLLAGITGGEVFIGAGYGTAGESGFKVSQADLGLVLYGTSGGASSAPATYALAGSGSVALVGVSGLTMTGNVSVARNNTAGRSVKAWPPGAGM
jgi:hypothetical protein